MCVEQRLKRLRLIPVRCIKSRSYLVGKLPVPLVQDFLVQTHSSWYEQRNSEQRDAHDPPEEHAGCTFFNLIHLSAFHVCA